MAKKMKMRLNIFDAIKKKNPPKNWFDMTHNHVTSFKMGQLVPTAVQEVLPGDEWKLSTANMLRFLPLVSPVMHRIQIRTEYFFVPSRILWADWDKWISRAVAVQHPYIRVNNGEVTVGSLCDYLGVPTGVHSFDFNALPLSGYLKIWDEFYRSQDLQNEVWQPLTAGDNTSALGAYIADGPLPCGWMRDYFTAALPFTQKGPDVDIPLVTEQTIPVELTPNGNPWGVVDPDTGSSQNVFGTLNEAAGPVPIAASLHNDGDPAALDPRGSLTVDVQASAANINTLRRAFRLQEWLETAARAGNRYKETLLGHFGVNTSDSRLQRPEYIGGFTQNMVISEVLSTAENTEANVPVGYLAGHGISAGGDGGYYFKAEEHGYLYCLTRVTPVTMYQQGLHRMFSRSDVFDYAWPEFANIGEQPILNREVKADHATPEGTFGYIPRYAEYKFANSRVSGEMRDSLSFWHLGRIFQSDPALNADFIKCDPSPRIFAVTDPDEDQITGQIIHDFQVKRILPKFGVPTI